jgi:hypothetical protein
LLSKQLYQQPTCTDVVIPQSSNHPASHKTAAFHYMGSKLPLTDIEKQKEIIVIKTLATNNGYTFHDIAKAHNRQKRENENMSTPKLKMKKYGLNLRISMIALEFSLKSSKNLISE